MLQNLKNLFIILLLSIFNSVFSQNIIIFIDQTESPNTLNKGNLQIESGYLSLKDRETNSKMTQSLINNLFRYGLNNNIELSSTYPI